MPHELFLITRQKSKVRNAFDNNMSTDIKLSEAQFSKIIQFGGLLGALLGKLTGPLMKVVAVPLAKIILTPPATVTSASAIEGGKCEEKSRKNAWKRCCKSRETNHFGHFEWIYR